jgi:hypothetical protein
METDDRKSNDPNRILRMVNRFLDMTFDNMVRVDTKFGSGYKFDGDNQYQLNVVKNDSGELQLAISSSFIKNITSMFDIDKFAASELIAEYCSDVLGMEFDFIRSWPISIPIKEEISEVKKVEDFDEDYPDYEYSQIGVLPKKDSDSQIGVVFFNGPDFNSSEYREPESPRMVYFIGPFGEFEFDSRMIKTNGKSPYVFGTDLKNVYYDKLLPLMKTKNVQPSSDDFTSDEILESLKNAFPDNWSEETEDTTAGLRGIHTIGEKTDTDIEWSIMNFFDTKQEVKSLINKKWKDEGSGYKIEWLSSVFKNDKKFLKTLLTKQWNSIKGGIENELSALKNLTDLLESTGVNFEYDVYPPGHKRDRYDSIDLTLKIAGEQPMTIQIKPVDKTERMPNGDIKIYTYGMSNSYKNKKDLGYILYNKGNSFIIFKNKNYYVTPAGKGREVIHKDKPFKVYKKK